MEHNGNIYFIEADYSIDCSLSYTCHCDTSFHERFVETPNTNVYRVSDTCIEAQPGYYVNTVGATEQTACPQGTYQPFYGSTTCIPCPDNNCQHLTAAKHHHDTTHQTPCPVGTFQPFYSATQCILCPEGEYQDMMGQNTCKQCEPGTQSSVGRTTCIPCLEGFKGVDGFCIPCPTGHYQTQQGQPICDMCDIGTYQSLQGQQTCLTCIQGTYTDTKASSSCQNTPLGHDWDDTSYKGTPCPLGSYQDEEGQLDCKKCDVGSFSASTGASICTPCGPGRYQTQQGAYNCTKCDEGMYQNEKGKTDCKECDFGTYSNYIEYDTYELSECMLCGRNEYQDTLKSSQCKQCTEGQYQSLIGKSFCNNKPFNKSICIVGYGKTNDNRCERCKVGEYSDASTCYQKSTTCPPGQGYYFTLRRQRDHCIPCPNNTYANQHDTQTCQPILVKSL